VSSLIILGIAALVVSGIGLFVAGVVKAMNKASHDAGVSEERNAETQRQNAAHGKANEVLAEHRDPDAVVDRLQRGDF
jgi:hypothetical protein